MKISKHLLCKLKNIVLLLLLFCSISLALYLSPLFDVRLNALVVSDKQSSTQLFYTIKPGGYAEEFSSTKVLSAGINNLAFHIPFSRSNLRWDISDRGGEYTIGNVKVSFLNFNWPVSYEKLLPGNEIESLAEMHGGILVKVAEESRDPCFYINLDMRRIFLIKLMSIFLLSAIITLAFMLRQRIRPVIDSIDRRYISEIGYIKNISLGNVNVALPFLILSAMGCLLYIHFVTNFSPSIDDEFAALRTLPDGWVGQGRWSIYLITKFLFTFPAIPFLPYVFFAGCLAYSYILLVALLDGNVSIKAYFLYPIFSFFPSWWCISEFYANVPSLAIGCVATTLATVLTINHRQNKAQGRGFTGFDLLPVLFLAFAYGTYQSYFLLYTAIYLSWILLRLHDGKDYAYLKTHIISFVIMGFSSLAVYFVFNKLFQLAIPTTSGYIDSYVNLGAIFHDTRNLILSLAYQMYSVYSGTETQYGYAIYFSSIIMMLPIFIFLNASRKTLVVLLYLLIVLSPFALGVIGGGIVMPLRTLVSLPFVFWFAAWIVIRKIDNKLITAIAFGIIAIFQIQFLTTTSQYIVTATLTQQNDRVLAAALNDRIQEVSGDTNGIIRVDIFGSRPFSSSYPSAFTSTTQASFFNWDNGTIFRMVSYMNMIGYKNIIPVYDEKERQDFNPTFEKMPVWPLEGSVKIVGNTVLVKLSQQADPVHGKFK